MTCPPHQWRRTDTLASAAGGALSVVLDDVGDEGVEVFVDARWCEGCPAVVFELHEPTPVMPLLAKWFDAGLQACSACGAPTLDLGRAIASQGGTSLHAPLDAQWTLGLAASACTRCGEVKLEVVRGELQAGAPAHARALRRRSRVEGARCQRCGAGDVREVALESHHSGPISLDAGPQSQNVVVQVCVECEAVELARRSEPQ